MPDLNGSGPYGQGHMTGRGAGKCIVPLNTKEEELTFLKNREKALTDELTTLKARINVLEKSQKRSKK